MTSTYPSAPSADLETLFGPIVVTATAGDSLNIESGIPLNVPIGEERGPKGELVINSIPCAVQHVMHCADGEWRHGWRDGDPYGSLRMPNITRRDNWQDGTSSMQRKAAGAFFQAVTEWAATEEGRSLLGAGEDANRTRDRHTIEDQLEKHREHVAAYERKLEQLDAGVSRQEYGGPYAHDERGEVL